MINKNERKGYKLMNKTQRVIFEIEAELEHRGILCSAKHDCDHILYIEDNFKKFFNLIGKTNTEWEVINANHVSYFENSKYSTVDRYPNENRNEHFRIKDVQQAEMFIDEEFTINVYVECLDKYTGIYTSLSILIDTDARLWTDGVLARRGK